MTTILLMQLLTLWLLAPVIAPVLGRMVAAAVEWAYVRRRHLVPSVALFVVIYLVLQLRG